MKQLMNRILDFFVVHRQQIVRVVMVVGIPLFVGLLLWQILLGYFDVNSWTGFGWHAGTNGASEPPRYLWDWLELFIVPLVLAGIAFWFNHSQTESKAQEEAENRRESTMQGYFDRITKLILDDNFDSAEIDKRSRVQAALQAHTTSVLQNLDTDRRSLVLRFLSEAGLVNLPGDATFVEPAKDIPQAKNKIPIKLENLELSGVILRGVNLRGANLNNSLLVKANLGSAILSDADLYMTNMFGAFLFWTKFSGAMMSSATLSFAQLINANLNEADIRSANLDSAVLSSACLCGAALLDANLVKATLHNADLTAANLRGAKLTDADLTEANLSRAILTEGKELQDVRTLRDTIMPDGRKWTGKTEGPYTIQELKPYCPYNDKKPQEGEGQS